MHQSGHCNVSLIWVLLTKTAHLFYDNHCENECSAPRQHGHSEQFNPEQFSINNGRSLLNQNSFHVNLSLHLTEVISIMTHIFVNFNNDTYFLLFNNLICKISSSQTSSQITTAHYLPLLFLIVILCFTPTLSKKKYKKRRWFK